MAENRVWKKSPANVMRLVNFKHLPGLLLMMLGIVLSSRWLPVAQAGASEISPQLREQVLQIIRENPEVILEAVQAYQRQQREQEQKARQSALQQLKTKPQALIGASPVKGAKDGKIVLIEFSDFQCPFCAQANSTLKQFMEKHGNTVALVYKHLPLTSIHPEALPAAKAAWAAGQQGKFWEFHEALFTNQKQLGNSLYTQIAQSLKLDLQKFDRDRNSPAAAAAIQQDLELADALGIDGTPFFIMNGEVLTGAVSLADLEATMTKVK
ncbi:MAG: thioredoxin domain-containing protein [Oscillatoriales cyanobacterium C42_A2020_001]|nr:thioredoxin domain-containing protein [Leptolyngbyaceae cyanobacterium C42_A2020_001]